MKPIASIPLSHPAKLLGTWFGSGLMPKGAGTAGSIAALPFAWVIQVYLSNFALFIAAVLAFFIGWAASNVYLRYTDARDPKEIVIDEVSGQWLLLSVMYPTLLSYVVGLVLFRFFDILKPWPISVSDRRIHGGFGVMFDDTLAAIYPVLIALVVCAIGQRLGHPGMLAALQQFLVQGHVL